MDNFHPVFRHFFMENYMEPSRWFECRLSYTRSVAATSIGNVVRMHMAKHLQSIGPPIFY